MLFGNSHEFAQLLSKPPRARGAPTAGDLAANPLLAPLLANNKAERERVVLTNLRESLTELMGGRLKQFPTKLKNSTVVRYQGDVARFRKWCETEGLSWLPAAPETLAAYLIEECSAKPRLAARTANAVRKLHLLSDRLTPTSSRFVRGALKYIAEHAAKASPPEEAA